METSKVIRAAMAHVAALRKAAMERPELNQAIIEVKKVQAQRFASTYADLLESPVYSPSARFFLEELYGARDFSLRDEQFARIAGALEFTFPSHVVATAIALARLHELTEEMDLAMAQHWAENGCYAFGERYVSAWRQVGRPTDRTWQLATVLNIGERLTDLTRKRSLRLMLKMMRKPAKLAGLESLQSFLEAGFDCFSEMAGRGGSAADFLDRIKKRETDWIDQLFNGDAIDCASRVNQLPTQIGAAP